MYRADAAAIHDVVSTLTDAVMLGNRAVSKWLSADGRMNITGDAQWFRRGFKSLTCTVCFMCARTGKLLGMSTLFKGTNYDLTQSSGGMEPEGMARIIAV